MTVAEWMLAAMPPLALALNCGSYLVARHAFRARLAVSIVAGLASGAAALVGITLAGWSLAGVDPWELWVSQVGTYLALSFCFWAFVNLNTTSLRIRLLKDLLDANGSRALSDLLATYSDEERLHRRLLRLKNAGQIVLVNGNWRLCAWQALFVARIIDVIRGLVGQR
jgi:hypothetical protein